jgi:hypothetical protein
MKQKTGGVQMSRMTLGERRDWLLDAINKAKADKRDTRALLEMLREVTTAMLSRSVRKARRAA